LVNFWLWPVWHDYMKLLYIEWSKENIDEEESVKRETGCHLFNG